jgi:hypothetical protein
VGPVVAAMRSRLGTSGDDDVVLPGRGHVVSPWGAAGPDPIGYGSQPDGKLRRATIAEEIPRSPGHIRDLDRGPQTHGRHSRRLGDRRERGGATAGLTGWLSEIPGWLRSLAAPPRWRLLAVSLLAVLIVAVSLVVSHAGGGPAVARSLTLPTPAVHTQPVTIVQPSASSAPTTSPTASATPAPTIAPTSAPAGQAFGAGGSGWQLADVRCCGVEAGTGYTRVVFDLGGSSGPSPTATVSFPTPTTMLVTFAGVTAPASVSAGGAGGVVTGVTRQSGSPVSFEISLSRPATIKGWAYSPGADAESSAPLHLYFDLD